jgi:hypothetical protein
LGLICIVPNLIDDDAIIVFLNYYNYEIKMLYYNIFISYSS